MKIAVVGSREFPDKELVQNVVFQLIRDGVMTEYVSGGASGVDTWGEETANQYNLKKSIYHANWSKYGKRAGAMRNQEIVDTADMILAFFDGTSKGTKITIDMAVKAGKPVNIYVRTK